MLSRTRLAGRVRIFVHRDRLRAPDFFLPATAQVVQTKRSAGTIVAGIALVLAVLGAVNVCRAATWWAGGAVAIVRRFGGALNLNIHIQRSREDP